MTAHVQASSKALTVHALARGPECSFRLEFLNSRLTRHGIGQGLPMYHAATRSIQPFRHGASARPTNVHPTNQQPTNNISYCQLKSVLAYHFGILSLWSRI